MAYIYKITNDINNKIYIGKTLNTPEDRFIQHKRDSSKRRNEKRPLYSAMRKYGTEHFFVETVEECGCDICSEREMFWIKYYNSYKNGYNATIGGDGTPTIDRALVISKYQEVLSCIEVAKELGISKDSVYDILNSEGIQRLSSAEVLRNKCKTINMYADKDKTILEKQFDNMREVYNYLIDNGITSQEYKNAIVHIQAICKGDSKRKSAYKKYWEYKN